MKVRGILSGFEMPAEIFLTDDVPYKNNEKIDYPALGKLAGKIVGVRYHRRFVH